MRYRRQATSDHSFEGGLLVSLMLAAAVAVGGCQKDKQMNAETSDETTSSSKEKSITEKMAKEHAGDSPKKSGIAKLEPAMAVETDKVKYATVGDNEVHGFFARPKDPEGPMPGIIAIHEWWGLNENIRNVTKLLAGEGYRVLAVDLYEGKTAETPDKAKELMGAAMNDKQRLKENLSDAYNYISSERNATRVGVIGWCFGGGWSLQTALMLPGELDATAIYYGELVTDADTLKPLEMPVIGFFGTEDSAISPSKVNAFEQAMNQAGNDVTIHNYEGAGHAFANPSGERYDPEAAMDAWNKTLDFFDAHLMQPLIEQTTDGSSGSSSDETSGSSGNQK